MSSLSLGVPSLHLQPRLLLQMPTLLNVRLDLRVLNFLLHLAPVLIFSIATLFFLFLDPRGHADRVAGLRRPNLALSVLDVEAILTLLLVEQGQKRVSLSRIPAAAAALHKVHGRREVYLSLRHRVRLDEDVLLVLQNAPEDGVQQRPRDGEWLGVLESEEEGVLAVVRFQNVDLSFLERKQCLLQTDDVSRAVALIHQLLESGSAVVSRVDTVEIGIVFRPDQNVDDRVMQVAGRLVETPVVDSRFRLYQLADRLQVPGLSPIKKRRIVEAVPGGRGCFCAEELAHDITAAVLCSQDQRRRPRHRRGEVHIGYVRVSFAFLSQPCSWFNLGVEALWRTLCIDQCLDGLRRDLSLSLATQGPRQYSGAFIPGYSVTGLR